MELISRQTGNFFFEVLKFLFGALGAALRWSHQAKRALPIGPTALYSTLVMRAAMLTQSQRPLAPRAGRVKSGRRPAASRAAAGDYDGYEIRERRLRYPDGYERVLR